MTGKHLRWAFEAVSNYAAFRVHGKAQSSVVVRAMPDDWPTGLVPVLDDLWSRPSTFDYDYADYLLVRTAISCHVGENPQDRAVNDLISHLFYLRKPIESFRVYMPFGKVPIELGRLKGSYRANALYSVLEVVKRVAKEKERTTGSEEAA